MVKLSFKDDSFLQALFLTFDNKTLSPPNQVKK